MFWNKPSLKSPEDRRKLETPVDYTKRTNRKEKRWTESLRNYHLSEINLRSIVNFNWSASFSSGSENLIPLAASRWLNASEANGNRKHKATITNWKCNRIVAPDLVPGLSRSSLFMIISQIGFAMPSSARPAPTMNRRINKFHTIGRTRGFCGISEKKSSNLFKKMKTTTQSSISMGLVWSNT